jgi:hypothetical protein
MRVAVVMNQKSPWTRETAMQLADLGAEVHVIDFETPGSQPEYLALTRFLSGGQCRL